MTEEILSSELFRKKIITRDDNGEFVLDCDTLLEEDINLYEDLTKKKTEEVVEEIKEKIKSDFSIINLKEEKSIASIRVEDLNSLVRIRGIIKRATKVVSRIKRIDFECNGCGSIIKVIQPSKKLRAPNKCSCSSRNFKLSKEIMVDIQELNLEEMPEESTGKQPQQIRVYLEGNMTDRTFSGRIQPGRRVEIVGIIKKLPIFMTKKDIEESISDFMLNAISINFLEEEEDMNLSEEDLRRIEEIAADNPLETLSRSLAPSIYGYNEIKKAIVLQLVKGVKKEKIDGTFTRGDIHILLTGDPGLAKSIRGDSKILYSAEKFNGEKVYGYEKISELYNKAKEYARINVLTIDQKNHKTLWKNIAGISKHLPDSKLIKIKTEHGREIVGTSSHSFLTINNLGEIISIKGNELSINHFVPIPKNYHFEDISKLDCSSLRNEATIRQPDINLNKDFGFFIGIFLAEGSLRESSKSVQISSFNKKIQDRIVAFVKKMGLNYYKDNKIIVISHFQLSKLMKKLCYSSMKKNSNKKVKKIPDFCFFAPREFLYGLISGLFSGDGSFIKSKGITCGLKSTSVSEELIDGTSNLLFALGILNKTRKRNKNYFLLIPKSELSKFLSKCHLLGKKYSKISKFKIDYSTPLRISKKICDSNILWSKITDIQEIDGDNEYVYDIQVNDTNTFVSNGIGVHNTQLLKIASLKSPRSKYLSGTRSSGVGITALVKKDELSGEWSVEAGAIVLAHGSVLCLDEADKMDKEQLGSLYEPLETQSVTITKAGINASLKSETSLLAGANPIRGKFNLEEPISRQIDLPLPLLNRFDLVFVMIDRQKEEFDREAVNHLFGIHKGENMNQSEILETPLLKKFIYYARKLKPKLKDELLDGIKELYLKIRKRSVGRDFSGVPINLRNVEGLIRLSEASAKLRLSEYVELEDLKIAESIFLYSLEQIGYDEVTGVLDMSRISERVPITRRGKMSSVLEVINNLSRQSANVTYDEIKKQSEEKGIYGWELQDFLEQLKRESRIYEPEKGVYKSI